MAVTNLTNTKWLLNATVDVSTDFTYYITFKNGYKVLNHTGEDIYKEIRVLSGYVSFRKGNAYYTMSSSTGEINYTYYRPLTITGGTDVTNSTVIAWFEANATQIEIDTDNYYPLDYIVTDGACVVDTGFKPNNNTHMFVSLYSIAGNQWIFGARQNTTFGFLDGGSAFYIYHGNTNTAVGSYSGSNQPLLIDINKDKFYFTYGNTSAIGTISTITYQNARNLYLFALNNNGTIASIAKSGSRFYESFIEDNGTLYGYYLPVMRKSDGLCGVYDCVSNTLLSNISTGKFLGFVCNPEEGGTITYSDDTTNATLTAVANSNYTFQDWNLANYTRLDYLETTGSQYFVTGFNCNNNTIVQLKHMVTANVNGGVIGSAWSGNALLIHTNSGSGGYTCYFGQPYAGVTHTLNEWNEIELKSGSVTINGTSYTVGTSIGSAYQTQLGVGMNSNGSTSYYSQGRYEYVKLWADSNTLSRYYIPVKRKSDNVVGMYDLVNGTFTTSATSTGFVGGNELGDFTLTDNPLTFKLGGNSGVIANFLINYNITLTYDSTLGSASYTTSGSDIILSASPNANAQLVGWYLNSVLLSTNNPYTYTPTGDVTIEARFDEVFDVTTSVNGSGAIDFTRGTDRNDVTFTVIPSSNWSFEKYVINGTEYFTTPLTIHLTQATTVTAYFTEDDKYFINASTNFEYGSIYLSDNDVYSGTVVTVWARPFPDYNFIRWSDGETQNPRQITVTSNITLIAIYQRVGDSNGIYQYRCYVKDQMALTDPPKAFMVVDTFDIRTDYLTNATSSVTVYSMASDVNEGDILVLYDPKGTTLYQGVINSIEDLEIGCSQMQSFYKGTWIYNISPQDYLEHEVAVLLQDYADGKLYRSNYVDNLVATRLGGITIDYTGSTTANLPTDLDDEGNEEMTTYDMEEWIYELYQKYSIEFDFEINFSGTNYVHIRVPSYPSIKVGNNMYAIQDMLPITEIEEMNKLVIYAQDKTYRTTYVATKNGIVEEPSSMANRFNITNTEVVFSDDPVEDLVASNLPDTMFNHKIEFDLIIKNFIYEFGDFNLGGELDIYYNDEYYNSVLTGYEISKSSNQNIVRVHMICGLVRKKLTQLLTLGKV